MRLRLFALVVVCVWLMSGGTAFGQGATTTTLSGTVVDTSGGVIPGADVNVKSNQTSTIYTAVTNEQGSFTIPSVQAGTYTVSVSLSGFKTAVLSNVTVNAAVPASVRVTLEIGGLQETVVVQSEASSIVQTQSSAVSTTVDIRQVQNLPLMSRNALDFVTFLPGVNTPSTNRNSTVAGLPQNAINITIDGINVQDNTLKSTDGFFTIVQPRLDAIEEVTVTMAGQDAQSSGQGAVQIQFVTRSGTNTFRGGLYHYYRNDTLNANTWFNKRNGVAKPELLQNQAGGRFGGPISIPGLFDWRGKAFFFVNYEEFRQPQQLTRTRNILSATAQAGLFRYTAGGVTREVNLLALAAARGLTSTVDPTIAKLLADIRAATTTTGAYIERSDPNVQGYTFNVDRRSLNRFPTVRLDYNVTDRHRLTGSWNYATFLSIPDTLNNRDPVFPGFPATAT
ncbi:MAG: carboxypeptidase regulatory-like domain-containing protein, partial [Acidobacteria bacterium]|nr:carboxypeptidase regulatory-like domain-containing protein [Acidobacteriota bacterium]